jgi:cysteine synthase B
MGVGRYLRREMPSVRLISLQPNGPLHGLEGLKHMETALVPAIYDDSLADDNREVDTEVAYATARRLARRLGVLVGPSSAANVSAALALGGELLDGGEGGDWTPQRPATVVTVLCDGAEKYLSESFWDVAD